MSRFDALLARHLRRRGYRVFEPVGLPHVGLYVPTRTGAAPRRVLLTQDDLVTYSDADGAHPWHNCRPSSFARWVATTQATFVP